VSVAVDTVERIEATLPEVLEVQRRGLVTLERARMAHGPVEEPSKLTLYVGRRARLDGKPAYVALTERLRAHGVAGATVLLGVDGTVDGERRRARFLARNVDVPMMLIAVGDGGPIGATLAELDGPLATLERIRVLKRDGERFAEPHTAPNVKLMVYGSEQDRHEELVRRLRAAGAAGATTVRGVWGFHGDHAPHGDRLVQLRRRVPSVTIVIDDPQRTWPIVDELTAVRGLVTSELVPTARTSDRP
jgi:PII-like signaling protein